VACDSTFAAGDDIAQLVETMGAAPLRSTLLHLLSAVEGSVP